VIAPAYAGFSQLDGGPQFEAWHGDCLAALDALAPGVMFDALISDPPYCSGGDNEAQRTRAKSQARKCVGSLPWFDGDNMGTAGLAYQLRAIVAKSLPRLNPGGSILLFCDWRMYAAVAPAVESVGLRLRNVLIWDKQNPAQGKGFRPQHEMILHLSRRTADFNRFDRGNVLRFPRVHHSAKVHPTQKPVELMAALVDVVTKPGGLVFDPFAGSCSTGVAALELGRSFLGVERDDRYLAFGADRLREALAKHDGRRAA
jgi:DNA modification methylase